jgi:hypothetical protein
MQTIAEIPAPRKPATAFYAHLFMDSGALVKVGGTLYFVGDDSTIVEVEPGMVNFLTVLGEMTLADAQRIEDLLACGPAAVACSREEGVR